MTISEFILFFKTYDIDIDIEGLRLSILLPCAMPTHYAGTSRTLNIIFEGQNIGKKRLHLFQVITFTHSKITNICSYCCGNMGSLESYHNAKLVILIDCTKLHGKQIKL